MRIPLIASRLSTAVCFAVATFGVVGGCAGTAPAEQALVTYVDATADPYRAYVTADASLDTDAKARRYSAIDAATSYVTNIRSRQTVAPTSTGGVTK